MLTPFSTNSITLVSKLNYSHNETKYLQNRLEDLAGSLAKAYKLNSEPKNNIKQIFEDTIRIFQNTKAKQSDYLVAILQEILVENNKLCTENKLLQQLNCIANLYILLNLFKSQLNANLPPIDRLTKLTFKKRYAIIEKENFLNLMTSYEMQNDLYSNSRQTTHPLCECIRRKVEEIDERIVTFDKYVAVRPENLNYTTVIKVNQFILTEKLK